MTAAPEVLPLPRCCETHNDWTTLAEHLVEDFPEVAAGEVLAEIARARGAVASFGLDGDGTTDAVQVAELIARYQLSLTAGRIEDVARLDPERHARGSRHTG